MFLLEFVYLKRKHNIRTSNIKRSDWHDFILQFSKVFHILPSIATKEITITQMILYPE
jgi:hypothetical protein